MAAKLKLEPVIASLLEPGEQSDCTVICGHLTFTAHKAVICTQSEFFKTALNSTFLVSSPPSQGNNQQFTICKKEGISSRVELRDQDPSIVQLAMRFFYSDKYKAEDLNSKWDGPRKRRISETEPDSSELLTHVKMFFLRTCCFQIDSGNSRCWQLKKSFEATALADLDTILKLVYEWPDPTSLP